MNKSKSRFVRAGKYLAAMGLLASFATLQGCTEKPPPAKAASEAPKAAPAPPAKVSVSVSGQAFIVTKGRQNIKLALVEVTAIPEKDAIEYIKSKRVEGLQKQALLRSDLDRATKEASAAANTATRREKEAEKAQKDRHEATMAAISKPSRDSLTRLQADSDALTKEFEEGSRLRDASHAKSGALAKMKAQHAYLESPAFYTEKLPGAVAQAKTDADGNFSLSVPPGKYVIAAVTSRAVFKDTENYHWLVMVVAATPIQGLMLSNDNLFGTNCRDCVALPKN